MNFFFFFSLIGVTNHSWLSQLHITSSNLDKPLRIEKPYFFIIKLILKNLLFIKSIIPEKSYDQIESSIF